jgi:adenylate cyclase
VAEQPVDRGELQRLGLYDPDDEHATERLQLIDYLIGLGATVEDLVEAGEDELPRVASMLSLRGHGRLTRAEVAERAGVPEALATRVWRASGFPDPGSEDRVCSEEDVDALRTFAAGIELLGAEETLQLARVIGSSLARIAEAMIATFMVHVAEPSLVGDPSGLELARANARAADLLRAAGVVNDFVLRRHIEIAQRPLVLGGQETQLRTVGFVDLVESTALARQLTMTELGASLVEFDELVSDLVVDRGARLVKLIGDEAMFVASDPGTACDVALALTARLAVHPRLPSARGAVASGEVLTRDGDYFGPVVNLAARAVKLADPGSVLASADVARDAAGGFEFTPAGGQQLKGFDEPVELFRIEREP